MFEMIEEIESPTGDKIPAAPLDLASPTDSTYDAH